MAKRGTHLVFLFLIAVTVSGCARFTDTLPLMPDHETYELYGSRTVGQTFVCHHAGLNEISVLLDASCSAAEITLHLRSSAQSSQDIAAVTLSPRSSEGLSFYRFELPIQDQVNGQAFYFSLESPQSTQGNGVLVPFNHDDLARDEVYLDGMPARGHLSFKLHYHVLYIVRDVLRQVFAAAGEVVWMLFLSLLLYLLPGGAVVVWFLRDGDRFERLIAAGCLSVVVNTLLLYTTLTGLRLGRAAVSIYLVLCGLAVVVRLGTRWKRVSWDVRGLDTRVRKLGAHVRREPVILVLGVVILLVLGVRVWITRDMVAPRWGDSYHHTVMTQLLLDQGGIFDSWEPYAPYSGLNTHFGFHANAALFHWLGGTEVTRAVIWAGQIMNVLAVLSLYPLGKRVGGPWAGTLSVLVAGLLAATPMIYVNWGRYPQLTGQILLPIAIWLLLLTLDRAERDWRLLVLAALAAVGQTLAYYRMPYYYVIFVLSILLCVYLPRFKFQWRSWLEVLLRLVSVAALVVVIMVPWGIHIVQGRLVASLGPSIARGRSVDQVRAEYGQWLLLPLYVSVPLLLAAGVAWIWALLHKDYASLSVGLWAVGMFAIVATRLIGLPGAAKMSAFASMIFMYAPVSLLIGGLGARGMAYLKRGSSRHWFSASAAVCLLLAFLGAYKMPGLSDPSHDLVKPEDLDSMAWIRAHTPQDARFLVNGFLIYDGRSIVGSDAGWWIPLFTARENTMPPQYALLSERETCPGYGHRMVDLVAGLRRTPLSTPEGLELVCDEGVTHVYVGQAEGLVGGPALGPLFTADELLDHPAFEVLYHRDKVWVFALADAACLPVGARSP